MTDLTLESLSRDVAEIREENIRLRAMLSLYGADPEKASEWISRIDQELLWFHGIIAGLRCDMDGLRSRP